MVVNGNITMVIYCIYNTINGINGYVNGNITNSMMMIIFIIYYYYYPFPWKCPLQKGYYYYYIPVGISTTKREDILL
jgi:hypothetical protein